MTHSSQDPSSFPKPSSLQRLIGRGVEFGFNAASKSASWIPKYKRALKSLDQRINLQYGDLEEQCLDIHYPPQWTQTQAVQNPLPTIFYIHGGGFRILSKETHWPFVYSFTQQGYAVVNINYRLAPRWVCPTALEDSLLALEWVLDRAQEYGLDTKQFHIAGESAGGNLTLAVGLCSVRRGSTPWAQRFYDRQWQPKSLLPACGFLDLAHPESHQDRVSSLVLNRIRLLCSTYLKGSSDPFWASPLVELEERQEEWQRSFPPLCITVGTNDFIYRDSLRLHQACTRLKIDHVYHEYPKKGHAFHAVLWNKAARQCWSDHFQFLKDLP